MRFKTAAGAIDCFLPGNFQIVSKLSDVLCLNAQENTFSVTKSLKHVKSEVKEYALCPKVFRWRVSNVSVATAKIGRAHV